MCFVGRALPGGGAQAWDQSDSQLQLHSACPLLAAGPGVSANSPDLVFLICQTEVREPPL